MLCMTSCLPESAARQEGGEMVEEEHDRTTKPEQLSQGVNDSPCIIYHMTHNQVHNECTFQHTHMMERLRNILENCEKPAATQD